MVGIWRRDGERWSPLAPSGFEDEAALQRRIAEAPEMLPLSGQPQLVVAGSEVRLGNGSVDVLAVETGGRPAVIEVKIGRNPEARRAVVAQALAYAASLHGMSVREFEDALAPRLREAGHESLADAMRAADQEGAFDEDPFREALAAHLREGSFRVVIVLDEAPPDLVRLAGYLETIADRIAVDLVTVGAYEVGGSQILLPQRIDPGRAPAEASAPRAPRRSGDRAVRSDGSGAFRDGARRRGTRRPRAHRRLGRRAGCRGAGARALGRGQERRPLHPAPAPPRQGLGHRHGLERWGARIPRGLPHRNRARSPRRARSHRAGGVPRA